MGQIESVIGVILGRGVGFVIFVLLLFGANWLTSYITVDAYISVVNFLNSNIYIIIVFTALLLIGEIFGVLMFPYNLPSPLFNAIGGIFLVRFIFDLVIFVESIMNVPANLRFDILRYIAYALVFILVIAIGYARILIAAGKMTFGTPYGTPEKVTLKKPVQAAKKPVIKKKTAKPKKQAKKKRIKNFFKYFFISPSTKS